MKKNDSVTYHFMLFPGMVLLAVFSIYPMFGTVIAFQDFSPVKGIWGSAFVGLSNFQYMLTIPDIGQVFYNTLFIAIMKIITSQLLAIVFALMLNELRSRFLKKTIQTLVYLPHFMSWVVLASIVVSILSIDGLFNNFIKGFGQQPIFFLGSNKTFPGVIIASNAWKEFGFNAIIFIAALTYINPVLYEAANIDGATRWQQLLHVTLPAIVPTIILILTLSLQNVLNAGFGQILNLYSPLVYQSGDIIDTYVYRAGLKDFQYELATAVGLLKSVVSLCLISVSYFIASKFANYRIF